MEDKLKEMLQGSLEAWANIDRSRAEQEKKDRKIISMYCAKNQPADIFRTIELLEKFNGLPEYDEQVIKKFKENYPKKITTKLLFDFLDVKDIYREFLESGGKNND